MLKERRIHFCVSGGIAAYKAIDLARIFVKAGAQVRVALTKSAEAFVTPMTFQALTGHVPLRSTSVESEGDVEQPSIIAHINFAQNCDALVVVPATANLLAKAACGLADDFVSSVLLAATVPIIAAPAMNSAMYLNPATQENLSVLKRRGWTIVEPGYGSLACGCEGPGRLADLDEIARSVERVVDKAHAPQPWINKKVLVTAGPTREYLDPVRFLSNPSSGKMGFALAEAALQMGAEVILVHGPVTIVPPESPHLKVLPVTSAKEMYDAVHAHAAQMDLVLMCAAVADLRPATCSPTKLPKGECSMPIEWLPTPDILASLGAWRADARTRGEKTPVLIGFAAQTGDPVAAAQEKRARKQVDWIVANDVTAEGAGFMSDTNRISLITASQVETWDLMSKKEVAERLCERIDACFFKESRA